MVQSLQIKVKREREDKNTFGQDMKNIPDAYSHIATKPEERDGSIRQGNAVLHDDNFISLKIDDEGHRTWSSWSAGPPRKKRWTADQLLQADRDECRSREKREAMSQAERESSLNSNQPPLGEPAQPQNKRRKAGNQRRRESKQAKSRRDLESLPQYTSGPITPCQPELKQEGSFSEQPKPCIVTGGESGGKDCNLQLGELRMRRSPAPSPRRAGWPAPPPWTLYQYQDQDKNTLTPQTISSIRQHERAQTILDALLAMNQIGDPAGYDAMVAFAFYDFGWRIHSRDQIIDRLKKELLKHEGAANPRDREGRDHRFDSQGHGSTGYRDDGQAVENQGGLEYRGEVLVKKEQASNVEFEDHGR